MITNLSLNDLSKRADTNDLIPQAVLNTPLSYFATKFGMEIEEDTDDLDQFRGAAVLLDDTYPVAIRHYNRHPPDTVTLYLPSDVRRVDEVTTIIRLLIEDFQLKESAIRWERAHDPAL
jgi:hypothetical protein